jgi:small subunit ribosomal protein S1
VADFKVGDVIDGTVTKLVNFGAFVRVRDGLEGLIHISELSHQRVAHPGDVVHEGQTLKLKIISLDSERHRLGLSLKQAEEPPARPAPEPGQQTAQAPSAPTPMQPRPERRPRPERGYSMTDAVQEPEGGIDNTLASAFAQIRAQVAESEAKAAGDEPATEAAPVEEAAPAAEAAAAPAKPARTRAPKAAKVEAPVEAVAEVPAEAVAEAPVEAVAEVPAEAVAEAPAEAVAETPAEAPADVPAEAAAEAPTE